MDKQDVPQEWIEAVLDSNADMRIEYGNIKTDWPQLLADIAPAIGRTVRERIAHEVESGPHEARSAAWWADYVRNVEL